MDRVFFLAANSGRGFFSLYDSFPPEGAFLHIIKGGPGTGKSGFMRRIRAAAEERGLDTETVLCSGDPDSLDALSIPALKQAWMDGTAPHVREPSVFGVNSDYVNLGAFCRLPLRVDDGERAVLLNHAYKAEYTAAYAALADALSMRQTCPEPGEDPDETERIKALMDSLIPVRASTGAASEKRFLSAISCRGILHLDGTVNLLCKQKYELRDSAGLELAARLAAERGAYAIVCPEPLDPERPEAVLLPEYSACFIRAENAGGQNAKFTEAMDRALAKLAGAKALHDELESLYRPYMDFEALTEYTDAYIDRLFR